MLVLSRKVNESIQITVPPSADSQAITVVLTEIRGDKVRIGFDADQSIMIHRDEIQDRIDSGVGFERPVKPPVVPVVVKIGQKLPGEK